MSSSVRAPKQTALDIAPVKDNLLVRPCEPDVSPGGLHIVRGTEDARDMHRAEKCEVLAIGPGEKRELENGVIIHLTPEQIMGVPISVGDVVWCVRYLGVHRIQRSDGTIDKIKIVKAEDVLGVGE